MRLFGRSSAIASDEKVREANPEQGKKDFKARSLTRSLVLFFVILAVAATVRDIRMPNADKAQAAFTDLVYEQMDAQKADFWLGETTAKELLVGAGWITESNGDPDIQRAVKRLLQQNNLETIIVRTWNTIKLEEAARLWDLWEETAPQQTEQTFISQQLALQQQNKTLPGLGEDLWMISTDVGEYLLAADGDLWGICPLKDLKHLD